MNDERKRQRERMFRENARAQGKYHLTSFMKF